MMRAIWKGAVSFGLVNIPVALYPVVRKDAVKLRMLRKSDLSPIVYKRAAQADDTEVPWEQIGKGYEYEKDRFVLLTEADFKQVGVEATQTIRILDFVSLAEIDPVHFDTAYYLEPQKGGNKAYQLLREVLVQTGKIGIAKVVIRTKEHLAALKANGPILLLQLMHFADEIASTEGLQLPQDEKLDKREIEMAKMLVSSMSNRWRPEQYKDDYNAALLEMIERKVKHGDQPEKSTKRKPAPKIADLLEVLQKSLDDAGKSSRKRKAA